MPTYEYVCKSCGHELEVFQSMTEAPKRKCPECGKNALERKIGTGAAVLFRGSGFYQTDYRSESYRKAAEAEKKPAEKGAGESGAKPDSKSPEKPEPKAKPAEPSKSADSPKPAAKKARSKKTDAA